MPGSFLTDSERKKLDQFPADITVDDLATYFTLTSHDISFVLKQRRDHNRLGFAILLCTLRYLGFCPSSFSEIPLIVANYIGRQLKISPHQLGSSDI